MAKKTSQDSWELFLSHGVHRESRTITIGWDEDADEDDRGEVTMKLALDIVQAVALLESDSVEKPINVILFSPGGSETAGWAIYDVLVNSPCPVTVKAIGECSSIATLIMQAGDNRLIYPNCTFLIHAGTESLPANHPVSIDRWNEFNKKWRRRYYEVLAIKSGNNDVKYWRRKCLFDNIMTAEEAVKEGLVDSIIGKPVPTTPIGEEE